MIERVVEYLVLRVWVPARVSRLVAAYVLLAEGVRQRVLDAWPYLFFEGAPSSGKTRTGRLLAGLAGGACSSGFSKAALFRWLTDHQGTLLFLDEASSLGRADLLGILNAAYQRGGAVHRCERHGTQIVTVESPIAAPVVFAANRRLPLSALESRCIPVRFREPSTAEFTAEPRDEGQEIVLRAEVEQWVTAQGAKIATACRRWLREPLFAGEPTGQRRRELYAPLFAVSEIAGGLDDLRSYAADHQDLRHIREREQDPHLDALLARLAAALKARGSAGPARFSAIREVVAEGGDGAGPPSDRTLAAALARTGWHRTKRHGEAAYFPPGTGLLARWRR